jgi:hypothetical protein
MAFTGDTTWKWKFRMATRGLDSPYYRFWRQSVRWLAGDEEDEEQTDAGEHVTAWTPRYAYEPDRHVPLRARVKDDADAPVSDATVEATIAYPVPVQTMGPAGMAQQRSASVPLRPGQEPGTYEADWLPPTAGLYQVTVGARRAGQPLGAAHTEFAVGLGVSAWTEQAQHEPGENLTIRARVLGRERQPQQNAEVNVRLEYPYPVQRLSATGETITEEGTTLALTDLPDVPGQYQVTWQPPLAGLYRATVFAGEPGEPGGSYLMEFVVGSAAPEFHELDVDQPGLRTLARVSRGRAHTQATAATIPDELDVRRQSEFRTDTISLWNAPWFFAVLLAALTGEWILRKRRALN